ncbi:MAG: response regulator transcription factor [Bacteroidota bacterium]|nr:response regulator transcription factor [Bacteroidota bacterium]
MKSKILLVDDEQDIIEFLQYNIEAAGYEVISASNGSEALEKVESLPDLIILDIMMPVIDGYEVCRRIRENKLTWKIPIIFLTAKSTEKDEVKGLELGADDFIAKPISPKKLVARIKANLRRKEISSDQKKEDLSILKIGPIEIDKERFEVKINGDSIFFPKKEFEILSYIAMQPGRVLTRDAILRDIWGDDIYITERTIDVHVRKIREKMGSFSDLIETIKGVGYRFKYIG